MLSPDRHSADENQYGITASLKKTVQRKRPSHRPRSQFDSDSSGEDEDRGERDSLRVQRVRAKEAHDDAERSPLRPAALTERSHRGFRVFPELPASPQRVPKRLIKASPSEGIIGLCVPANVPPKVVTIQDYSFSSGAVSVFAGQTILFTLARDVPVHVEHVLEGTCEENSGLCFVSPILQVGRMCFGYLCKYHAYYLLLLKSRCRALSIPLLPSRRYTWAKSMCRARCIPRWSVACLSSRPSRSGASLAPCPPLPALAFYRLPHTSFRAQGWAHLGDPSTRCRRL